MSVKERIEEQLGSHDVLLYMKGTPDFPQCGFSGQTVAALNAIGKPYSFVNIFEDPEIREGLKEYSNWPTFPQLYVKGELIGGCDIVVEMYHSGELEESLLDGEPRPAPMWGHLGVLSLTAAAGRCAATSRRYPGSDSRFHKTDRRSARRRTMPSAPAFHPNPVRPAIAARASTVWPKATPHNVAVSKQLNG